MQLSASEKELQFKFRKVTLQQKKKKKKATKKQRMSN